MVAGFRQFSSQLMYDDGGQILLTTAMQEDPDPRILDPRVEHRLAEHPTELWAHPMPFEHTQYRRTMTPLTAQPRVFTPPSSSEGCYHAPRRESAACLSLAGGVLFPPSLPCDCGEPRPVLKLSSFAASSGFCTSNERQPADIPAPVTLRCTSSRCGPSVPAI
ncbi:hypothetical protein FB451DRAFT_1513723 [Mycena latifolia]|nr:hypothetical protein FB451DRAFT_1513723 [Mycena latifolia]